MHCLTFLVFLLFDSNLPALSLPFFLPMCMNMQPLLQQTSPFHYIFDYGKLDVSLPAIAIKLCLKATCEELGPFLMSRDTMRCFA